MDGSAKEGGAGERGCCAMTSNPPDVRPILERQKARVAERPNELSDIEKLLYPAWLDHDSATGGPSYLGYVMLILAVALPLQLGVMAILLVLVD